MITIPRYITHDYILENQQWTFVYSTNFWENQNVGSAAICKGCKNAFGVPVRWRLCRSSGYFQDAQAEEIIKKIDEMVSRIDTSKPVILFPKIGNGHSQMSTFAPKCWEYLMSKLNAIKTDVKYTS